MYAGFHIPGNYRRRGHHRRHHRHHHRNGQKKDGESEEGRPGNLIHLICECKQNADNDWFLVTPPGERVQFILGEDDQDGSHEAHPVFSELEELVPIGDGSEFEWKETAR